MLLRQMRPKLTVPPREIDYLCSYYEIGKRQSYGKITIGNINTNYYVRTDNGEYVFRFYTFKEKRHVKEEHRLLHYLYEKGFPTPRPVMRDGDSFVRYKNTIVACFAYERGVHEHKLDKHDFRQVARTTARLHKLSGDYTPGTHLEGEGLEDVKKEIRKRSAELKRAEFTNATQFIKTLKEELEKIRFPHTLPQGIVHVDVKDENVLFYNHKFEALLDFDNAYKDALVIDIGSCLLWWCTSSHDGLDKQRMKIFLAEYENERPLTNTERKYVMDAVRFNALKQAFKYAYVCLPSRRYAEHKAKEFMNIYWQLSE